MTAVIEFESVSKCYRVANQRPFLAREMFRRILQKPSHIAQHWALEGVSFRVAEGEALGVVGANGSGKSTLLRLIARTTYPTSGKVRVHGRVGPLLELGAGFHADLTGYENIYLNASLLGLTREQVDDRLQSIIDYSGIREFIHAPLKTYSTGMVTRLGFAVIAHIDPDILLIDEVLAVGDAQFREKCQETIDKFIASGTTLFIVSHEPSVLQRLCNRLLWLREGKLEASGEPKEILAQYWRFWQASRAAAATKGAAES